MQEYSPVAQFASACEKMNEFAQALRETNRFHEVRAGADIRSYQSGWRLEKWVEAKLDANEGLWAAWWLELGPHQDGWVLESSLAVSPDVLFIGLDDRIAKTPETLEEQLSAVLDDLKGALQRRREFADEVWKRLEKGGPENPEGIKP